MKQLKKILVVTVFILLVLQSTVYAADYRVVANDSLYKIGQLFKVPVDTIKADNNLNTNTINIGDVLHVPALVYTVKSGDTLTRIANKYGVTVDSIKIANHKTGSLIKIGQKLIIPGVKPAGGTGTVIPYTTNEVDLLARLIEAEASGEPYQAKVGVGAVVVNRVQSKEWAPTLTDVIYQKYGEYYQFTPVKNGMINNPASDDSIRAAWAALYDSDPSNGAIFYFDDSSTNQWLWSKPQTAVIGRMVFCK